MSKQLLTDHIYPGDVLNNLKKFPDKSIRCIITSPPYYSTAIWTGGDEKCDHKPSSTPNKRLGFTQGGG